MQRTSVEAAECLVAETLSLASPVRHSHPHCIRPGRWHPEAQDTSALQSKACQAWHVIPVDPSAVLAAREETACLEAQSTLQIAENVRRHGELDVCCRIDFANFNSIGRGLDYQPR